MATKRLQLEVEKTVRDANATISTYDFRWQDLCELNIAVAEAEADVQASTDSAKPAVKGKKNAGKQNGSARRNKRRRRSSI